MVCILSAKGAVCNNLRYFSSKRVDKQRLSGTIDLQIGIIVGGKEYV